MFGTKPFRTHVICSEERYASTLKDIGEIQPDIISFNEVSTTFNKMIRECSWIRANYWVNEYFYESVKGFSNILLTKMKPLFYDKIMVNELKRPIEIAFFHIKNSKN